MKKSFSFLIIVLGMLIGCDEQSLEISPRDNPEFELQQDLKSNSLGGVVGLSSCQPNSGSGVYPKTGDYNCHQYVRAALIKKQVNLTTGEPDGINFGNLVSSTIQQDADFIRVCYSSDADAVAHLPMSKDHSTLMVGSIYAYSYPGGTMINRSGSALNYGTSCDYEYFAAIPDIKINGPIRVGNNYRFILENRNLYSFILSDNLRWTYNTNNFTEVSKSDTELIITPKPGMSGTHTVSATLNTSATKNPIGACAKGVNGLENATQYSPVRTKSFMVTSDCSGTLDNGSLYTFNNVSKGVLHKIIMNASSWTWVKTSGNASWSTASGGKEMTFTISSGSATFNAYGSGCNITLIFNSY